MCRWVVHAIVRYGPWLQYMQARDERGLVAIDGAVCVDAQKAFERLAQGGYGSVDHGWLTWLLPSKLTRAVEGLLNEKA